MILLVTLGLIFSVIPFALTKMNIFPASLGKDLNYLIVTMHDSPNSKSYGNEMRIKSISVNGELLDMGEISNDSWVWHPEWGYVLYQHGDSTLEIKINKPVQALILTFIKQEGSGKCTISFNDSAKRSYDMYSSNWHEEVFFVKFVDDAQMVLIKLSVGIILFCVLFMLYRIILYLIGAKAVIPQKIGIGSFDFAKGIGMIGIMLGHSAQDVSIDNAYIAYGIIPAIVTITLMYAILPMFDIISGYGIRGSNPLKTLKKQLKLLFDFYVIYAFGVLLIDIVKVFVISDFKANELSNHLLALLLMTEHDLTIFGLKIGNIGPMWFFVSLCLGKVVLNQVLLVRNDKLQILIMLLVLIPFYFSIKLDLAIFCLTPLFSAIIFLYIGHCLSKYNVLKSSSRWVRIAFILGIIVFYSVAAFNGVFISIAGNNWGNDVFVGLFTAALGGIVLTWFSLEYGNTLFLKLGYVREIGRKSIFALLAHSIEYTTIPWKTIMESVKLGFYSKTVLIFVCRLVVTFVLARIIIFVYGKTHQKAI